MQHVMLKKLMIMSAVTLAMVTSSLSANPWEWIASKLSRRYDPIGFIASGVGVGVIAAHAVLTRTLTHPQEIEPVEGQRYRAGLIPKRREEELK